MTAKKKLVTSAVKCALDNPDWLPPFVDFLFPRTGEAHEPIIDDLLITYSAFNVAMTALEDLFEFDKSVISEHCILLLGESRLGKTRILIELISKHMPKWTPTGLLMPIIYVDVPEKPTIRSVAKAILKQFGEKPGRRDSVEDILDSIVELGGNCGVHLICLDDMHHFVDQRGQPGQFELTEWLKRLVVRMRVALVISGLDRTEVGVRLNPQLLLRMDQKLRLARFDWRIDADAAKFKKIVGGMCGRIRKEFLVSAAIESQVFRWYVACSGRLGTFVKLVRRVLKVARKEKAKEITLAILDAAWLKSEFDAASQPASQHPFGVEFNLVPDDLSIARAMTAGAEVVVDKRVGSRASKERAPSSASRKRNVKKAMGA